VAGGLSSRTRLGERGPRCRQSANRRGDEDVGTAKRIAAGRRSAWRASGDRCHGYGRLLERRRCEQSERAADDVCMIVVSISGMLDRILTAAMRAALQ